MLYKISYMIIFQKYVYHSYIDMLVCKKNKWNLLIFLMSMKFTHINMAIIYIAMYTKFEVKLQMTNKKGKKIL